MRYFTEEEFTFSPCRLNGAGFWINTVVAGQPLYLYVTWDQADALKDMLEMVLKHRPVSARPLLIKIHREE